MDHVKSANKDIMSLLKKIFTKGGDMGVVMVWANGDEMIAYTCKDFKQVQELLDHAKKAGTLH